MSKGGVDVALTCACGTVKGVARTLSASSTNHMICSCRSCQSYAHYLGRADDILDENGGSSLFHMNPTDFDITEGQDQVTCMRISQKGPVRWYTSCCKTPLGNSFPHGEKPIFIGLFPMLLGEMGKPERFTSLVGPVRGHNAQPSPVSFTDKLRLWKMTGRLIGKVLLWKFSAAHPGPSFFTAMSEGAGKNPPILSPEQLNKIQTEANI